MGGDWGKKTLQSTREPTKARRLAGAPTVRANALCVVAACTTPERENMVGEKKREKDVEKERNTNEETSKRPKTRWKEQMKARAMYATLTTATAKMRPMRLMPAMRWSVSGLVKVCESRSDLCM